MSVQRYDFVLAPGLTDWDASAEKADAGTFVLYEDYAKLEAQIRSMQEHYIGKVSGAAQQRSGGENG